MARAVEKIDALPASGRSNGSLAEYGKLIDRLKADARSRRMAEIAQRNGLPIYF
jgi:hypothetical protein